MARHSRSRRTPAALRHSVATSLVGLVLASLPATAQTVQTVLAGVAPGDLSAGGAPASPQVTLVPGWRMPDGTRVAAIEIRLAPGWHTYWRVPGEAGIPPHFDWTGSRNLSGISYEWPRPKVFATEGMQTFGYEQRLVLPVRLKPTDPDAPMTLSLDASIGVCSDICMAAEAQTGLTLTPDSPEAGRGEIEAALAERMRSAEEAGVVRATCAFSQAAGGNEITATVTFDHAAGADRIAIIEAGAPDVWVGMPESRVSGRILTASAPVETVGAGGPMVARSDVRLTVLGAEDAVDIRGCQAP